MASFEAEVAAFQENVTAAEEAECQPEASREKIECEQVVVDGKVLRGSDRQASGLAPRMVVSAYHVQERRVWKQVATQGRGREARLAMDLIRLLDLEGSVVSAD